MAEGYVIVDLGMTPEEYQQAVATGQFNATEKHFNDIANAIKSEKMMLVVGNTFDGTIVVPASPYIVRDSSGVWNTVGYLTSPTIVEGNVVSLFVYIGRATLTGHVMPVVLSNLI